MYGWGMQTAVLEGYSEGALCAAAHTCTGLARNAWHGEVYLGRSVSSTVKVVLLVKVDVFTALKGIMHTIKANMKYCAAFSYNTRELHACMWRMHVVVRLVC